MFYRWNFLCLREDIQNAPQIKIATQIEIKADKIIKDFNTEKFKCMQTLNFFRILIPATLYFFL